MNIDQIIEGLTILRQYYGAKSPYCVSAEHDEIWVSATVMPLPKEAIDKLHALGWLQNVADGIDYSPDEPWIAYV